MILRLSVALITGVLICRTGIALVAQDKAATVEEAKLDPQLEVNREVLLNKGSTERNRINAASLMLFNPDPVARKILLECLAQSENPATQVAICRALGQSRTEARPFPGPEDFIQPLLRILAGQDQAAARLAAEAALIFSYDTIGTPIEKLARDRTIAVSGRLNAIYALKLQPDKRAAITLIALVDDPDEQVAAQAMDALHAIGIPVGKDPEARSQIIYELQRKSKEEFLRDWLIRQEERMREERGETQTWKDLFLRMLDAYYGLLSDDAERGRVVAEQLGARQTELKLWALNKLYLWRVEGAGRPGLPLLPGIEPTLIGLISDADRDVRLETAKLLTLMGQVSPPDKLLAQLDVEQDGEVKTKLFRALGPVWDFALLPESGVRVSPEVRTRTLDWAARFLSEQDPDKSRDGAEVIQKLMMTEKSGLKEVDRYLELLEQRFRQTVPTEATLRSDLVRVMGSLCSERSACKERARVRFEPVFELARGDEGDRVREQAVEGLIQIGKASALKKLHQDGLTDRSPNIRKRLIDLAGEVGEAGDLDWLVARVGPSHPESEAVWQAVLGVLSRSDVATLRRWLGRFKAGDPVALAPEQWTSFLQLAERKAGGQPELTREVLEELVAYHRQRGDQAAEEGSLARLLAVSGESDRDAVAGRLLHVYLRQSKVDEAAALLQDALEKRDMADQDPIVLAVEGYLQEGGEGQEHLKVVGEVAKKVVSKAPRPGWEQVKQHWLEPQGNSEGPSQDGEARAAN